MPDRGISAIRQPDVPVLRKFVRFRLTVPVIFRWKDQEGKRQEARGVTRDVSAGGAFVLSEHCPPAECILRYQVFLPPIHAGAPPFRIKAAGRVMRTEEGHADRNGKGFAVFSSKFVLRNGAELPVQGQQNSALKK